MAEAEQADGMSGHEVENLTDLGNAKRLARRFAGELRYVSTWGRWLVWDGARWLPDETEQALRVCSSELAAIVLEEAADLKRRGEDADVLKPYRKWAGACEFARTVQHAMHLARAREELAVHHGQLDQHPMLLNTPAGTVDLATGQMRLHDRGELHTKRTGVPFDPNCPTPRWDQFLAQVIPDAAVRAFVQRAVGYSATADVGEHVFFLLHGGGQNGKTTFLNIVQDVLGDYADQSAPDLLLAKKHDSHPTEVAELVGKRFVSATEARTGRRLDDALTKRITGGDHLRGRYMRQDFFTFQPSHKLWLAVNSLPQVDDPTHAMWRRIRRIPFEVQVPPGQRERNLDRHLVDEEGPGILAWIVEGAAAWAAGDLNTPLEVELATDEYRQDEDHVSQFVEDCLVFDASARTSSAELRQAYKTWAHESGIDERRLVSDKVMAGRLADLGARKGKVRQARGHLGVGLLSAPTLQAGR